MEEQDLKDENEKLKALLEAKKLKDENERLKAQREENEKLKTMLEEKKLKDENETLKQAINETTVSNDDELQRKIAMLESKISSTPVTKKTFWQTINNWKGGLGLVGIIGLLEIIINGAE